MKKLIFLTRLLILILLIIVTNGVTYSDWINIGIFYDECITTNGSNIYVGGAPIYSSTNNGSTWTNIGLDSIYGVCSMAVYNNNIFAGTVSNGIFRTTNNGSTWLTVNNGLTLHRTNGLAFNGNNIFTAQIFAGVFLSTNNGESWTAVNNGIPIQSLMGLVSHGNNIYVIANGSVYVTTNNGSMWSPILTTYPVERLGIDGNNLVAGDDNGKVILSTNNGSSWTVIDNGLTSEPIISLAISGSNIFAGTFRENGLVLKIYFTSNYGQTWLNVTDNVYGADFFFLKVYNDNIFAGTASGVWRRPLSEIIGIQPNNNNIPEKFSLSQNYPNPFNPSTIINYQLPINSVVKLVVYDLLGQEVKTLVNEKQNAGSYQVEFDGSNLSSGVYFYKLQAGNFIETKKMSLIK